MGNKAFLKKKEDTAIKKNKFILYNYTIHIHNIHS